MKLRGWRHDYASCTCAGHPFKCYTHPYSCSCKLPLQGEPVRPESAEIMATFDALPADVCFAVAFADFPWEPWQLREALGSEDEPLSPAVVARLDRDGHKRLDYLRRNRLGPYAIGRSVGRRP